jgi:hypothetical protein
MSESADLLTLLLRKSIIAGNSVLFFLVVSSVDEKEIIIGLVICGFSILAGTFLIIELFEWLWGIDALRLVKPRPVLIYEGRPWWMKNVAALLFAAFSFTLLIEGTFLLFFPYAIPGTLIPLGLFWLLILVSLAIVIPADRKKGSLSPEIQDDASGKEE